MPEKYRETAKVISQEQIGTGIFSMWIQTERIAEAARPGQFISVYPGYYGSARKRFPAGA